MTLQEAIFGAVYRPPGPELTGPDLFEEGIEPALYLQLLEATREEWLLKFGLDPVEYAFENEQLPQTRTVRRRGKKRCRREIDTV